MKKRLVFQSFKKYVVNDISVYYYAIDYENDYVLQIKSASFGGLLPIEIVTTCIENTRQANRVKITKDEFMAEYKKALKLLQNVNIVIR